MPRARRPLTLRFSAVVFPGMLLSVNEGPVTGRRLEALFVRFGGFRVGTLDALNPKAVDIAVFSVCSLDAANPAAATNRLEPVELQRTGGLMENGKAF